MSEKIKGELEKFEETLISYVKEIKDKWRTDTKFNTVNNWTFEHKGITYRVSRNVKNFTDDVVYCLTAELFKPVYFGSSKQDLLAHVAELLRG